MARVRGIALSLELVLVCLSPFASAGTAGSAEPDSDAPLQPARRGPIEARDEWLLAQSRLTLPAMSPDPLAPGETRLRLDGDWGNDFGFREGPLTPPRDVQFLVDGEHRTLALDVRRGLGRSLTVGARLPLQWRGPGVLDGLIDTFHRVTGLPGDLRLQFSENQYRIEGHDSAFTPVRWTAPPGTGLGDLELFGQWAFRRPPPSSGRARGRAWAGGLVLRGSLPTGTGPFADGGAEGGAQLLAARPLADAWDVYLGLGGTASARRRSDGIAYRTARPSGFLAVEWRPFRRWSLVVQSDMAGRLVTNLATYPGFEAYFRMEAKLDLSRRWRLEGGFTEGLKGVDATTDFGLFAGLSGRFGGRPVP